MEDWKRFRLPLILCVGAILLFLLLREGWAWQVLQVLREAMADPRLLRQAILEQGGAWAPLLFVGLQILQVILFPIPGEASGFLGGYLFGIWQGFTLSTLGLTLGSLIAFGISRFFCGLVLRRIYPTKVYQRFNKLVYKGDFLIPLLLFLLPGFPKDSLSYLLGLSLMPWRIFLAIAAVGRIPGTLMLSLQGAQVYEGNYLLLGLLLLGSLLLSLLFYLARKRILLWLSRLGSSGQNPAPPHGNSDPLRKGSQP